MRAIKVLAIEADVMARTGAARARLRARAATEADRAAVRRLSALAAAHAHAMCADIPDYVACRSRAYVWAWHALTGRYHATAARLAAWRAFRRGARW